MQEYIEFARDNAILFIGFFAVIGVIIWTELGRLKRKYQLVPTTAVVRMMNDDNTVLVDVREDKEIKDGMITGAKHIPLSSFATRASELDKFKSAPIVIYCLSGTRSGGACSTLTKAGFENVNSLVGGMSAWETAGLPVTRR